MTFITVPGEHLNGASKNEEWPEPIELPGKPDVPTWPEELLPDVLRPWICDVVDRTQCPIEFPSVGAVVALAGVVGRGCAIRPKQRDEWIVVPNLWGAVVGPPSSMKSPALREAMRPLRALDAEASEEYDAQAFERSVLESKRKALGKQLDKAAESELDQKKKPRANEIENLKVEFEEIETELAAATARRRYVVCDATVEKLGELLEQNPRGLLVFRDELVGWLRTMDRSGRESDRTFYLEAWNGTDEYTYDRISRGHVRIEAACVSVLGGVQPGPLGDYLQAAQKGGVGDDGLVQRFQLLVYPDQPKEWKYVDQWPRTDARKKVLELYRRLANAHPSEFGADIDSKFPFLRFSEAGQAIFAEWQEKLMLRLRGGNEHPLVAAHLNKYSSLMPSLALLFQLADHGGGAVDEQATLRATAWCDVLELHMRRVYASIEQSKHARAAALLARLKAGALKSPFAPRDVYRRHWSQLDSPEDVAAAIESLVEHGWLKKLTIHTAGRPKDVLHVHPRIGG